ncbi:type III secretion system inner rod subunit SctI [Pantoea endophytica]|uniref:Type III secretion system inner rod subunit SctI n=1 Tax=Pantoea sp. BJ2 TaxID=3141322 RepID=A0AAU7U3G1_9GAMM
MQIQMPDFATGMSESQPEVSALNLEDRLVSALSQASETQYVAKANELYRVQDPANTGSPEDLFLFQTRVSEYNITMSLYAALTRKAVTAIDTVLRA